MILGPTRVTVEIRPLDRDGTPRDDLARRASTVRKYRPTISVIAEIHWTDHRARVTEGMSGADVETSGIMVLPIRNAERANYTPDSGDLVTAITERNGKRQSYDGEQLYVNKATPTMPGPGGFQAYECALRDRSAGR